MEFFAVIAEKSQSRGGKSPFSRAFAMADPHDTYGKPIAQRMSNQRM
jgi:hypothetical protein